MSESAVISQAKVLTEGGDLSQREQVQPNKHFIRPGRVIFSAQGKRILEFVWEKHENDQPITRGAVHWKTPHP